MSHENANVFNLNKYGDLTNFDVSLCDFILLISQDNETTKTFKIILNFIFRIHRLNPQLVDEINDWDADKGASEFPWLTLG